ncbi:MAG: transporter substrate-binding domain-containing protein [Deltaproteobacteria bacterium]|nr:transporter substrate-binding domain-containing protein [Deltaproteobacteria bacterium]
MIDRILTLILITLLALSVPATAGKIQDELASESTVEAVLKRGVLRVGFSTFAPWAMQAKDGTFVGFEIDVAERLARDMGVRPEFVPTKWSGIIPALITGKFDVIIGGMGIRPDRNLKVNFTIPYDHSGMALVANTSKAKGFDSLEKFNDHGVVLAVRLGATSVDAAKKHMPRAQVRMFDDEAQAVQEVLSGRAHAFVSSAPGPAFLALKHPDKLFLPVQGTFTREPIGFAVRKGDPDTLNYFDNWIRVVEAEGWIAERKAYWFETRDWEKDLK